MRTKDEIINIVMHAFVDEDNYNAQNLNAREIALRLNPKRYKITLFYTNEPDKRLLNRDNIDLRKVSKNKIVQSLEVTKELLSRDYDLFFYVRVHLVDFVYFRLRWLLRDRKKRFIQLKTLYHIQPLALGTILLVGMHLIVMPYIQ
ncbi:hypothetical protein AOA80_04445 [Methanomassiliicoccales archaeon RumEn M1]|nr:hypothetical protein AOA80_04445 [Methanomassiliicoccales archaeon RumEn M1]